MVLRREFLLAYTVSASHGHEVDASKVRASILAFSNLPNWNRIEFQETVFKGTLDVLGNDLYDQRLNAIKQVRVQFKTALECIPKVRWSFLKVHIVLMVDGLVEPFEIDLKL